MHGKRTFKEVYLNELNKELVNTAEMKLLPYRFVVIKGEMIGPPTWPKTCLLKM